jgi:hypothetical protein
MMDLIPEAVEAVTYAPDGKSYVKTKFRPDMESKRLELFQTIAAGQNGTLPPNLAARYPGLAEEHPFYEPPRTSWNEDAKRCPPRRTLPAGIDPRILQAVGQSAAQQQLPGHLVGLPASTRSEYDSQTGVIKRKIPGPIGRIKHAVLGG